MLRHIQTSCYSPLSADHGKHIVPIAITMLTASMTHTSGLVSTSRNSVNRNVFQKSLAPMALRQRSTSTIHAEANNTGGSRGGSITNSGKTAQPDSYEVCKAATTRYARSSVLAATARLQPADMCLMLADCSHDSCCQPWYSLYVVICMRISA